MEGYTVNIKFSSFELTPKQRVMLKDTSDCIKIDALVNNGESPIIHPVGYAILEVHNEKAKDSKDYEVYILVDNDGNKYVTGSPSFFTSFREIFDEMAGVEEEWGVKIYRLASKNYSGKYFLTCSVV